MVVFPNCKINLGLNITGTREDGYHDLETVFYPLAFHDALEVVKGIEEQKFQVSLTGFSNEITDDNNLCKKAYEILKKDYPDLPAVQCYVHKAIPAGAGLAGGSSDAAFMLMLLNKKFNLGLSFEKLSAYALQLGSDCPFFVINKPCFAQGRGEILTQLNIDLSPYQFLLVNPGIHISTRWAFSKISIAAPAIPVNELVQQPVSTWKEQLINDFEEPMTQYYPQLSTLKRQLYDAGSLYAAMTGSGSTFFGIFPPEHKINPAMFPPEYFVKLVNGF